MPGTVTIAALCDRIGHGGDGFRGILRLLRSRHLQMLNHERIGRSSRIINVKEV